MTMMQVLLALVMVLIIKLLLHEDDKWNYQLTSYKVD